jgi:hypothetical protein
MSGLRRAHRRAPSRQAANIERCPALRLVCSPIAFWDADNTTVEAETVSATRRNEMAKQPPEFTAAEQAWLAQQKAEFLRRHPEIALRRNPTVREEKEDEKDREYLRQHPTFRAQLNRKSRVKD